MVNGIIRYCDTKANHKEMRLKAGLTSSRVCKMTNTLKQNSKCGKRSKETENRTELTLA